MRVFFDYQAYDLQTHGGVSHCMTELCKNFPSSVDVSIGVLETDNVYLRELGCSPMGYLYKQFLGIEKFKGKRKIFTPYFKLRHGFDYWGDKNQNYSIKILREGNYDVFHPTFFDDYFLPYLNQTPFVLTIHDMIPELYPQYFGTDDFQVVKKRKLAPLAAHIVVPSMQTKIDVVRILGVPKNKVTVVYHGSYPYHPINWNKQPRIIHNPYILYVGSRDKYKKFDYFIESCVSILKDNPDMRVVCTGVGFNDEEQALLEKYHVVDKFINVFVKAESDMMNLYHYALAFVYPSEYEGFGLPILECYKADGLLILNHASCFPEIAEDAALYFSIDKKGEGLSDVLETVLKMTPEEKLKQLDKQRNRLQAFSWQKSAQQLANIYQNIIENNDNKTNKQR